MLTETLSASNSPSSRSKASSYMLAEYLLSPSTLTERLANNISPDSVNKANGKMADRLKELNYSMGKQIQVAKSDTAKQDMLETELQSMLKEIISHQK